MWAPVLVVKILGKPLKGVLAEAPPGELCIYIPRVDTNLDWDESLIFLEWEGLHVINLPSEGPISL